MPRVASERRADPIEHEIDAEQLDLRQPHARQADLGDAGAAADVEDALAGSRAQRLHQELGERVGPPLLAKVLEGGRGQCVELSTHFLDRGASPRRTPHLHPSAQSTRAGDPGRRRSRGPLCPAPLRRGAAFGAPSNRGASPRRTPHLHPSAQSTRAGDPGRRRSRGPLCPAPLPPSPRLRRAAVASAEAGRRGAAFGAPSRVIRLRRNDQRIHVSSRLTS